MKIIVPSPAKINLSLWVKGKREDGYHEIITVMHTVGLFDFIHIRRSESLRLSIEGSSTLPSGEENLIIKACKLFHEKTGIKPDVNIKLEKNIPVGAGLGGGSSNAANTLKALNRMNGYPLKEEELFELASLIGSDVPFFIKGGLAISYGRGEKLKFYKPSDFKVLIIYPRFSCSTREVYEKLPEVKNRLKVEDAEKLIISPLETGDIGRVIENLSNDLEKSESECVKKVLRIKEELKSFYIGTVMSGSGSSLFSIVPNEIDISPLKKKGWWFKFCHAI